MHASSVGVRALPAPTAASARLDRVAQLQKASRGGRASYRTQPLPSLRSSANLLGERGRRASSCRLVDGLRGWTQSYAVAAPEQEKRTPAASARTGTPASCSGAPPPKLQRRAAGHAVRASRFKPFEEARAHVHAQGLRSQRQWQEWCRRGERPEDVPADPASTYHRKGWRSWADWLGYGAGRGPRGEFLVFTEAREIVRAQKLQRQRDWHEWCRQGRRPADIPADPASTYRDEGWRSWADWLGAGSSTSAVPQGPRDEFLPLDEARGIVRQLGLTSRVQWQDWSRDARPANIPSNPQATYREEGWRSWPDWLGYGPRRPARSHAERRRRFRPFPEARAYVRAQGLQSHRQWQAWRQQRPPDIPAAPSAVYRDAGWRSWPDWLGYGEAHGPRGEFLVFTEAREVVRSLGLRSQAQWQAWCAEGHRPADIPSNPHLVYRDEGWLSYPDWLGYGRGRAPRSAFLPFAEARALVARLGLRSQRDWQAWCREGRRPAHIPARPDVVYRDVGWQSWPDWLRGHPVEELEPPPSDPPTVQKEPFFEEAQAFVRARGMEWYQ